MSEVVDMLARNRPRFGYPYEYEPEEHRALVKKIQPIVKELFENCRRLVEELFK